MPTAAEILDKKQKLSEADLQDLREHADDFGRPSGGAEVRMHVELIDAIQSLDSATTRLMRVAIGVAVAACFVSAGQIIAAVLLRH